MQIKTFFACACACGALSLSLFAAPAPGEKLPIYNLKEDGAVLLSEAVIQKVVAKDFEVRKKLSDPRFYKDVQGTFKDLLRELTADPFDGRMVATDKSLSDEEQKELWDIWKAYEAYMRRCDMRRVMGAMLSFYEASSLFRYTARVERAEDFYKSDRMKKLLHDMKMFDATFNQLNTTIAKKYEASGSFGKTMSDLFDSETYFGAYISAEGRPNSSFWNSLAVLRRYNARMCDDELKAMKASIAEFDKKLAETEDLRRRAVETASFYKNGYPALAGIVELDERIIDCVTLAISELSGSIKKLENRDSDAFQLRTGLPMYHVFAQVDVRTDDPEGPNFCLLVKMAYYHLLNKFNEMSKKRNGVSIPLR